MPVRQLKRNLLTSDIAQSLQDLDELACFEKMSSQGENIEEALWKKIETKGLYGLGITSNYGGLGFGVIEQLYVLELVAQLSSSTAFLLYQHYQNCNELLHFSTEKQKDEFLPKFARNWFCASAASNVKIIGTESPKLEAKFANGEWCLNGARQICSGYLIASVFICRAMTNLGDAMFLVPRLTNGFSIGEELELMGLQSTTGSVLLHNVRLPNEAILGNLGQANDILRYDGVTGLHVGVLAIGTAIRCLDITNELLNSSSRNQNTDQLMILYGNLTDLRDMIYSRTKQFLENGTLCSETARDQLTNMKKECTQKSSEIITRCLELLGKNAYIKKNFVESCLRDCLGFHLISPT
ncbi:MAG: acyl-CoA dehydrogenase family protein [Nitrososphaerales archaeon]